MKRKSRTIYIGSDEERSQIFNFFTKKYDIKRKQIEVFDSKKILSNGDEITVVLWDKPLKDDYFDFLKFVFNVRRSAFSKKYYFSLVVKSHKKPQLNLFLMRLGFNIFF